MFVRGRKFSGGLRLGRVARACVLILVGWTLGAWAAAQALVVSAGVARADAVVVLAGSSAYAERARYAARLFAEGRAPRIVLTDDGERGGWSSAEQRNPYFVERAVRELTAAGVPTQRIEVLPGVVTSTHEEALRVRDYATSRAFRSLLVVTSPYHARRALWTLRRVFAGSGIEVGLSPSTNGGEATPSPLTWWLAPGNWKVVAGEYVKLAYYHARY